MQLIEFDTINGKVPEYLISYISYKVLKKNHNNKHCYVGIVDNVPDGVITLSEHGFISAIKTATILNGEENPIELTDKEKEEVAQAFLNKYPIEKTKTTIQNQNRRDCSDFIYSKYSKEVQQSAALGIYSDVRTGTVTDHIQRVIKEENRVYDLLETSNDPINVESPSWPEA